MRWVHIRRPFLNTSKINQLCKYTNKEDFKFRIHIYLYICPSRGDGPSLITLLTEVLWKGPSVCICRCKLKCPVRTPTLTALRINLPVRWGCGVDLLEPFWGKTLSLSASSLSHGKWLAYLCSPTLGKRANASENSIWTLIMDRPGKVQVNKTSKYKFGTSKTSAAWLHSLNNATRKVLNIIF